MISPETFARYAAMRVPRYTSYPPATSFSPAIDQAEYRAWLRRLPAEEAVSLYLHIPFCREMCWYCGCHTTVTHRQAPVSRYVRTLIREIELVAAELTARPTIGHLHLGGGSPTLLKAADIRQLHVTLTSRFDLAANAELAVELDPRTLSEELARAFVDAGINRASLGVQSFDPDVQAAINRIQSFETITCAVAMLRSVGIDALNFDLIYGLPLQTVESCQETVEQALRLEPSRFAVFGYAHVPSFKAHQRKINEAALPSPIERQAQARAIADRLRAAGYVEIGFDHFAHPDDSLAVAARQRRLARNFQGYTADTCRALIGFGSSAIGRLPQGFVQNTARIGDYQDRIDAGRLATVRGYKLTPDDRRRAAIIEQLMCSYRADVGLLDAPVADLERDGLIKRSGNIIEVVDAARPLVRAVAAAFDAKLGTSGAKHVTAV